MLPLSFFYVFFHSFCSDGSYGLVEVSFAPELVSPEEMAKEVLVRFSHLPAGVSFQFLHCLHHADFSCVLHEQVNVVRSAFYCPHMDAELSCCLHEVGNGQFPSHGVCKDCSPVCGCELQVPVAFSHAMVACAITCHVSHLPKGFLRRKHQLGWSFQVRQHQADTFFLSLREEIVY